MASNNQNNQNMTARTRMEELAAVRVRMREELERMNAEHSELQENFNRWASLLEFLQRESRARGAAIALITDSEEFWERLENHRSMIIDQEFLLSRAIDANFALHEASNRHRETRRILMAQFDELLDEELDGGDTDTDTDTDIDTDTSNTGAAPPDAPANQ